MDQSSYARRLVVRLLASTAVLAFGYARTTAAVEDRACGLVLPNVGGGLQPIFGDQPDLEVKSGTPVSEGFGIHGAVRDYQGRLLAGAFVQASPGTANTPAVPELAVFTDAEGAYYWPLPPGLYRLSVTYASGGTEVMVQVPADGHARQDFTLR